MTIDRDTKYSKRSRKFIAKGGTEVIRLPPLSTNLIAFAERFVRSIKEECLWKVIFVGQVSLRRAITEYMGHFHEARNHQGLENRPIREMPAGAANDATIHRRARPVECSVTTTVSLREAFVRDSGHYGLYVHYCGAQ